MRKARSRSIAGRGRFSISSLDGTNNPKWRCGILDIRHRPGTPAGVGAVFEQGMKGPAGRRIDADYEIVESAAPSFIKFQVTAGPARPAGTFMVEPEGNTTTVTFVLDFKPRGLARLMDGMIAREMQREMGGLAALKKALEGA